MTIKKMICLMMTLMLLAGFAACGKGTDVPADDEEELTQIAAAAEAETEEAPASDETTDPEDAENSELSEMLSCTEFDAKTGTFTISGVEEFSMPSTYDVSVVRHLVIADDVRSADLETYNHKYLRMETVQCDPDCSVSVLTSSITGSPFYRNSANWTDGVLYIGSGIAAINQDAPKVCKLKSNVSVISRSVQGDLHKTAPQIERFEIAEGNETFWTDENGILYTKYDIGTGIALYPPACPMKTYDVPDYVETLDIPETGNLQTIHISAKSSLNESNICVPPVSEFRVDAGHPTMYAQDGVLFKKGTTEYENKDETVLLCYPGKKPAKEYRIPDGTNRTAYHAFNGCLYLETLYVPASMTGFDYFEGFFPAFYGCKKLAHVYVDQGNERYSSTKDGLFLIPYTDWDTDDNETKRIRMIYLPGRTDKHFTIPSEIHEFEAYGNDYIETIDLGKDVNAFSVDACPALQAFRAENNKHGYYTQDGVLYKKWQDWNDPEKEDTCLVYYPAGRKDKQFTVPDGVTQLFGAIEWSSDSAFHNNPYIEEITLPDSVTLIGIGAFAGCTSLKKVNLPDTLKNLGNGSFHGCTSLKEITIPTSLEALGYYDGPDNYALGGSSVTDIYYKGTRVQWDKLVHAITSYPAVLPGGVHVHCTDD